MEQPEECDRDHARRRQFIPVVALIAGAYGTVAEARKALKKNSDCLKDFLVVDASSLPQSLKLKGKFVLAALSAKALLAEQVFKGVRQCAPAVNIQLLKFQPSR